MRRGGLGRGLEALIPADSRREGVAGYQELPLSAVRPSAHQPREHFDEESLAALAASIQAVGVLQPILVRPVGDGEFELIAGERRWRAARRAGLSRIPAIVQEASDREVLERAVVENLHREGLTPLEEAGAYQQLIEDFGLSHDEVARRVGRSRSAVTNTLRLFQLSPSVQRLVATGELSAGHARAVLGTPDRDEQERLAIQAAREGWSVRTLEERVRRSASQRETPTRSRKERPPGVLELERRLSDVLETRVRIDLHGERGSVVIDFADLDDLERIYRVVAQAAPGLRGGDEFDDA